MTACMASRVVTEAIFWQRCCGARLAASSNSNNNSASYTKQILVNMVMSSFF